MASTEISGGRLTRRVLTSTGEYVYGWSNYPENYMYGNSGDDTLIAQANDLCGYGYNYLNGNGGNDRLYAGTNAPSRIYGGFGNDFLQGNDRNDTLNGEAGNDTFYGMGGNDYISDVSGDNHVDGNDGADTIMLANGVEHVWGDNGADFIQCTNIKNTSVIRGGAGNDDIEVTGVGFDVYGDENADTIKATNTDASIWTKECEVLGGGGNDSIKAIGNKFRIVGNSGADFIDVSSAYDSKIVYHVISDSPLGNGDTIHNRGAWSDTRIDLTWLGHLQWQPYAGDFGAGYCHLENHAGHSDFYAYFNNGVFALHFDRGGQSRDQFLLG